MSERPANIEAEFALIGAAMLDIGVLDHAEVVRPDHFAEGFNGRLWAALLEHRAAGTLADPVSLGARFELDPGLQSLGGVRFLSDLVINAPPTIAAPTYAELIVDAAVRRDVIDLADHAKRNALQPGQGEAVVALLESGCASIAKEASVGSTGLPLGLSALENVEAAVSGEFRGTEVGLGALDRVTGGLKREDVWIIGGRSSMGKSIMGLALGRGVAEQGLGVLMFSLEMPVREVQARVIADIAHTEHGLPVRYSDILKGKLHGDQLDRARVAARKLASLPFIVTDRGGLTIEDVRRQALRQVRSWERMGAQAGAILIDHLGLVQPVRKTDNKAADTSDTVNELKSIAKQLGCPIIALAQVNRGPENRTDKRPTMGDLNWSGSIEQIADFVCLLYRQAYYDSRSPDADLRLNADANEHELELLIQKNRAGPVCTVKAWIDIAANAVRDIPQDHWRAA